MLAELVVLVALSSASGKGLVMARRGAAAAGSRMQHSARSQAVAPEKPPSLLPHYPAAPCPPTTLAPPLPPPPPDLLSRRSTVWSDCASATAAQGCWRPSGRWCWSSRCWALSPWH